MKRIVWLSNFRFSESPGASSGSWIESMGKGLVSENKYQISNITLGNVDSIVQSDACGVKQWIIPIKSVARKPLWGNPGSKLVKDIVCLVNERIVPDLVHVWGTERFWGLLTARHVINGPSLLEIQGITSAMVPYLSGGLTVDDIRHCTRVKEWLRPGLSIAAGQRMYRKSAVIEREMYAGHSYIAYQSDWVRAYVQPYAQSAKLFRTRMVLRNEFLQGARWSFKPGNHLVFTNCGWSPNKGLIILVRACAILKEFYPNIRLAVAGYLQSGIKRGGYARFVIDEARRLGVNLQCLGAIDAPNMIKQMHQASVYVNPSLVESYSMSLAEAMAIGCPCVVSYAGAMPEVGGSSCLYFPIADAGMCADCIRKVFDAGREVETMCDEARQRSLVMHAREAGIQRQMEIYDAILNNR